MTPSKPYGDWGTDLSRSTRVLGTESFKIAALFAGGFLALSGVLLGVVYWIVNDTQVAVLVADIDSDIVNMQDAYRDKGVPEVIEDVERRLESVNPRHTNAPPGYYLLQDRRLGKLAGNLDAFSPVLGLTRMETPQPSGHVPLMGRGVFLADGVYFFAGRDLRPIVNTKTRLLHAFIWVAGALIVVAVIGATLLGLRYMVRIDAISRTCESIIAGKFNDRIAVRGNGDELDRLSSAINNMLDRISALLDNLRQVSSDIAHDLRTPLTHLRTRLENARDRSITPEDYAAAIGQAIGDTDRLLRIFGALLCISQVESGSRRASFAECSLSGLLERLYELYRPLAEDQQHNLQQAIEEKVSVRGDSELLTQMFSNLLENSLHHTPPHSQIRISLETKGGLAAVMVADDGPGIPVKERENVLRRFYRLARSRTTPGNGLGLALASAIAGLHDARLELEDGGPGLQVRVIFPIVSG